MRYFKCIQKISLVPLIFAIVLLLSLSIPCIQTHAADGEKHVAVDAKGGAWTYTPGPLEWAGSMDRIAYVFYYVDKSGSRIGNTFLVAPSGGQDDLADWSRHCQLGITSKITQEELNPEIVTEDLGIPSTIGASGGDWIPSNDMEPWLLSEAFERNGRTYTNAEAIILDRGGKEMLKKIYKEEAYLCFEIVSGTYAYTNRVVDKCVRDVMRSGKNIEMMEKELKKAGFENVDWYSILTGAGEHVGGGFQDNYLYDLVWDIFNNKIGTTKTKYMYTATSFANLLDSFDVDIRKRGAGSNESDVKVSSSYTDGDQYDRGTGNHKWVQAMLKSCRITEKHPGIKLKTVSETANPNISSSEARSSAWGIGLVTAEAPPLHTYNGKSSPGAPEPPDETTSGNCSIYKYYIDSTIKVDQNGKTTYENNLVAGSPFKEIGSVTDYISIDEEGDYKGYDLVEWGVSTSNN